MSVRKVKEEEPFCHEWPIALVILSLCGLSVVAWADELGYLTSPYAAAIDTVSGLDCDISGNTTLVFDLTFRVANRGYLSSTCVGAGATVVVTYAGVSLATGPVRPLCARPRANAYRRVVARGDAVRVPGFALDGLVAAARRGVQVFDVTVGMPGTLVSCRGLRVRDDAALRSPCAASHGEP